MKKSTALVLALICIVSLVGCGNTPGCTSERAEPTADCADPVVQESWSGTITDIFTEGSGADQAEVITLEIEGHDPMHFTLVEGTEYLCFHMETEETVEITKEDLCIGAHVEIDCENDPNSGYRPILSVKLIVEETAIIWDYLPMVMVNGTLYLDTGHESTVTARCGVMDGTITSTTDGVPAEDGQSNFGTGYGFQYGPAEGTIEVLIDDTWWVFATEEVRQEIQFPAEETDTLPDSVADFETVVTISTEDAEEIANILCDGTVSDGVPACICVRWEDGTSDCIPDCAIMLDGVLYYYHSDCGTVTDEPNEQSLHLDEDCKTALNTLLGQYLRLGSEPVSPAQ